MRWEKMEVGGGTYRISGITAWIFILIFSMACPAIASDPELREIRFEKEKDGEESVLFLLNGDYPPKTFAIEGKKPRLVCDFFDARLNKKVKKLTITDGRLIKTIRVGIHLSPVPKTRVVLDLWPDQNYEVLQAFFYDEKTYALALRLKDIPLK
jgi:hypothetical protein